MYLRYCIQKLIYCNSESSTSSLLINDEYGLCIDFTSYGVILVVKNKLQVCFCISNITNVKRFIEIVNKKNGVRYVNYSEKNIIIGNVTLILSDDNKDIKNITVYCS